MIYSRSEVSRPYLKLSLLRLNQTQEHEMKQQGTKYQHAQWNISGSHMKMLPLLGGHGAFQEEEKCEKHICTS